MTSNSLTTLSPSFLTRRFQNLVDWLYPMRSADRALISLFHTTIWSEYRRTIAFFFFFGSPCYLLPGAFVDWFLYPHALGPLLVIRILMIVNLWLVGGSVLIFQREPALRVFNLAGISASILAICLVGLRSDLNSLYIYVMAPLIALASFPVPLTSLVIIYVTELLLFLAVTPGFGISLSTEFLAPGIQIFVATTLICFFFHAILMHQRWYAFLDRQKIQDLNLQLHQTNSHLQLLTDKFRDELAVAQTIQQSLLPPYRQTWSDVELACWSMPAREVGGDFYTYTDLPGGRRAVAIGDVSGKGLPAALLMSLSLATLQTTIQGVDSPDGLLVALDHALRRYTQATRQNCALCCAWVEGARVVVANAGCVTPLVRRRCGRVEWLDVGGLPLGTGLDHKLGYRAVSCNLGHGDLVIFTSDGIVDAKGRSQDLFGFERLEQVVAAGPASSAEAMLAHLQATLQAYVGNTEPHDDMTIVVLRLTGDISKE